MFNYKNNKSRGFRGQHGKFGNAKKSGNSGRNKNFSGGERNFHSFGNRSRGGGGSRIKSFDPSKIIALSSMSESVATTSEVYVPKNSFSDFKLSYKLISNILSRKFKDPTPIQDQAVPQILEGRDVVGVANTGTGKTAAFLIPLIDKLEKNNRSRVLIVAPTRELALQIDNELQNLSRGFGLYSAVCIGGVSIRGQIYSLSRNPHFVIGTPGRLLDLNEQKKINFSNYSNIVLDEVDRMLDMGFVKDVQRIITQLPANRQSLFFSATLSGEIQNIMKTFVKNPVNISVKSQDITTSVKQEVVKLEGREKMHVLYEIVDSHEVTKALIFSRTKHGADRIHKNLVEKRFLSTVIHGNKTQNQRQKALDSFKSGKNNILVATDVASRGIDVSDVSHVINYDLPASYEDYIHRIGRTGRAGKKGIALTFV